MKSLYLTLCLFFVQNVALLAQQTQKGLTAANGQYVGFLEFKPYDYNSNSDKHPLIIFLHGIGERGNGTTELSRVSANAIPRYCANGATMQFSYNNQNFSFLVLSPQLSASYGLWEPFYVEEMIKYAKQNLRVDPNRIYLCGLSLGGGGTWRYATASAANALGLAAIAPVCGTNDTYSEGICYMASQNLPVWAFHAEDDGTVSFGNTTYIVGQMNACSPPPGVAPKTTIYKTGGHGIWDRAFDTAHTFQTPQNVYEWMLSNSRSAAAPVNQIPVANAGADVTITMPTNSVTLNGNASKDPDGSIASYSWTKVSGPTQGTIASASAASTSVTGLTQGIYKFQLTVKDNTGASASDEVIVTVNAQPTVNQQPVANAGVDIEITLPTNSITLDGSASSDPDGTITSYRWTQVGGPSQYSITSPTSAKTTVTGLVEGTYYFQLIVADNATGAADDLVVVTVKPNIPPPPANQQPVANAGGDIGINLPTNSVTLNGSNSSDQDGSIVSYGWTQVGGPSQYTITSPNSATTTVTNLVQGTYYFQLIVADNSGGAAVDFVVVEVGAAAQNSVNKLPVSNAGSDVTLTLPTSSGTLNGSLSYDPDGTIQYYGWSLLSGPAQYKIENGYGKTTAVSNLVQGVYSFLLVVTDNKGSYSRDTVVFTVKGATSSARTAATTQPGMHRLLGATLVLPTFGDDNSVLTGKHLKVFPVPAKNVINIQYKSQNNCRLSVIITDMTGRQVYNQFLNKDLVTVLKGIDISGLQSGLYYLELKEPNGSRLLRSFTKQ